MFRGDLVERRNVLVLEFDGNFDQPVFVFAVIVVVMGVAALFVVYMLLIHVQNPSATEITEHTERIAPVSSVFLFRGVVLCTLCVLCDSKSKQYTHHHRHRKEQHDG
jgi:low temperature requirement protein LtrA